MTAAHRTGDLSARLGPDAQERATKKKGRDVHDVPGPDEESTSALILSPATPAHKLERAPDGRASEKRGAHAVASAAWMLGIELYPQPDGTFLALRWGLARRFGSIGEVEAWLDSAAQRDGR